MVALAFITDNRYTESDQHGMIEAELKWCEAWRWCVHVCGFDRRRTQSAQAPSWPQGPGTRPSSSGTSALDCVSSLWSVWASRLWERWGRRGMGDGKGGGDVLEQDHQVLGRQHWTVSSLWSVWTSPQCGVSGQGGVVVEGGWGGGGGAGVVGQDGWRVFTCLLLWLLGVPATGQDVTCKLSIFLACCSQRHHWPSLFYTIVHNTDPGWGSQGQQKNTDWSSWLPVSTALTCAKVTSFWERQHFCFEWN